ncbi:MAG: DUF4269 domain-containing protein [Woeseiaceae bacterium]
MKRLPFGQVLDQLDILRALAEFEPTVIGTPPLGIDIESSDIDIACTAKDLNRFKSDVTKRFGHESVFCTEDLQRFTDPAVRIAFWTSNWEIELFCQAIPIREQWGVRHFLIEKRLLELRPSLRDKVIDLKRSGLKTEPAFAALLKLEGDPYEAMLKLEILSDEELGALAV